MVVRSFFYQANVQRKVSCAMKISASCLCVPEACDVMQTESKSAGVSQLEKVLIGKYIQENNWT